MQPGKARARAGGDPVSETSIDNSRRHGLTLPVLAHSIKGWRWLLLMFELFLFALILILPQVDLPDLAFQRGSAPVVAKAKVSSPPVLATVSGTLQSARAQRFDNPPQRTATLLNRSTQDSSLSLLCMWIC